MLQLVHTRTPLIEVFVDRCRSITPRPNSGLLVLTQAGDMAFRDAQEWRRLPDLDISRFCRSGMTDQSPLSDLTLKSSVDG